MADQGRASTLAEMEVRGGFVAHLEWVLITRSITTARIELNTYPAVHGVGGRLTSTGWATKTGQGLPSNKALHLPFIASRIYSGLNSDL